jgi:hypothetical protein
VNFYQQNAKLLSVWNYLWRTYKDNGGVPREISNAISLIQERLVGAL